MQTEKHLQVTSLRTAIAQAEWQGVTWVRSPQGKLAGVTQEARANYEMTQLHDARDAVVAFVCGR